MVHPDQPNVPKADIRKKLAAVMKAKEEAIYVFGLKTQFGGGRSTGFALVYDSPEIRKKLSPKYWNKRVGAYLLTLLRINSMTPRARPESRRRRSRDV